MSATRAIARAKTPAHRRGRRRELAQLAARLRSSIRFARLWQQHSDAKRAGLAHVYAPLERALGLRRNVRRMTDEGNALAREILGVEVDE